MLTSERNMMMGRPYYHKKNTQRNRNYLNLHHVILVGDHDDTIIEPSVSGDTWH